MSVVTTESEVAEGDDVAATLMLDNPVAFRITVLVFIVDVARRRERRTSMAPQNRIVSTSGVTEVTLSVSTVQDKLAEGDEKFAYQSQANGLPDDSQLGGATVGSVTIIDDDHAPEVSTPTSLKAADYTTSIATLRATDQDGDDLTWEITGGDDRGLFSLTGEGALSFTSRQSHDSPRDANRDRFYRVNVEVTDGFNPTEARLTVELLPGLIVENVTRTAADVTVNVPLGHVGDTAQLQYGASYGEWTTLRSTAAGGGELFALSGLGAGTHYAVRATLHDNPLRYDDWSRGRFRTDLSLLWGPDWIMAEATGDGGYELSWSETNAIQPGNPPLETGYRIVRMAVPIYHPTVTFEVNNSETTTHTDPGPLVLGVTYYYTISAVNEDGPSYSGSPVIVTPQASQGFTETAPGAPRNLRLDRNVPAGQVKLVWDAPGDGSATGYIVVLHRIGDHLPNGSWRGETLASGVSSTTFTDHLTRDDFPDEGYVHRAYYVHSVNANGVRSEQAPLVVILPAPPREYCVNHIEPLP